MKELIGKVIEKIEKTYSNESKEIIIKRTGQATKRLKISKNNFQKINDNQNSRKQFLSTLSLTHPKIIFIDGGNAEILKSSNFSLQFLRIYSCTYSGRKRINGNRKEFFSIISTKIRPDNKIEYSIEIEGNKETNKKSFIIKENETEDTTSCGDIIRRNMELEECLELISKNAGNIIVIDGCLTYKTETEKKLLEEIKTKSSEKGISIIGISKTNTIITDSGNNACIELSKIQPEGKWLYKIIQEDKMSIGITKLYEKSKYLFRADIFGNPESISELICISKDPIFTGYPYPLIEADKFARVSNKEKELLKIKIMASAGKKWSKISSLIKTSDAHSILDNIS